MHESFETGVIPLLNLIMKILKRVDPELFDMLKDEFPMPTFALSWLLTWFSHDIADLDKVQIIYDACLSQHPMFIAYLAVAVIEYNREKVIS